MNEENIEPEIFSTDSDPGTPNAMKAIGSIVAHPKRVRGVFAAPLVRSGASRSRHPRGLLSSVYQIVIRLALFLVASVSV